MNMKKFFKQLHLWLSVPVGLIIVCICLSGTFMVFQEDIIQAFNPQLYRVKEQGKPLSADSLMKVASLSLPDSVQATGITVSANPERSYRVNLTKPWDGALFINQYTGRVLGMKPDYPFFQTMFKLHTALLGQSTHGGEASFGERVIGITTLLMVIILITGFIVWYPKTWRLLKMRLQISLRRGWQRFLYDLHVSAGAYVLLFLLACALTGLTWSFDWYKKGFYSLFGGVEEEKEVVKGTDALSSASVKAKTDALSSASVRSGKKKTNVVSSISATGKNNNQTKVDATTSATAQNMAVDGISSASVQKHASASVPKAEKKVEAKHKVDGTTSATKQKHQENVPVEEVDVKTSATQKETVDAETSAGKPKHNDTTVTESVDATTSATRQKKVDATTSATQKQHEVEESKPVDGVTSASTLHKKKTSVAKSTSVRKSVKKKVDGVTSASPGNDKEPTNSKLRADSQNNTVASKNNSRGSEKGLTSTEKTDGVSSASTLETKSNETAFSSVYLQPILNKLQKKVPDYKTITLNVDASAKVVRRGGWNNPSAADIYTFNSENGTLTGIHLYKDKPLSQRAGDWVHAVHVGSWGGVLTKILTCLACLIGTTLPLTGYYLWLKRWLKKSKRRK